MSCAQEGVIDVRDQRPVYSDEIPTMPKLFGGLLVGEDDDGTMTTTTTSRIRSTRRSDQGQGRGWGTVQRHAQIQL